MALDLCLESAGWVAQYIEANAANPLTMLRWSSKTDGRSTETTSSSVQPGPDIGPVDEITVRQAAAGLPIDQAKAVWLVDVCGYRYSEAAASVGVNRIEMAERINAARQSIRHNLEPSDIQA